MNASKLPSLDCLCGTFRRTGRALGQVYETALRPFGLRVTQFTILQALERAGEVTQGKLGDILAMDSTSLTRTLGIMVRQGWVVERRGKDRRERWLSLSKRGGTLLKRATPAWEQVQSSLRRAIGEGAWENLMRWANQVTGIAVTQGESL
jgi:DNA-binding MarR family transcriptional regulator